MGTLCTTLHLSTDPRAVDSVCNAVRFRRPRVQMLSVFLARVDARPVVLIRLVIGAACIVRGLEEWRVMERVFGPDIIRFPVFEWLPMISREVSLSLVVIWI